MGKGIVLRPPVTYPGKLFSRHFGKCLEVKHYSWPDIYDVFSLLLLRGWATTHSMYHSLGPSWVQAMQLHKKSKRLMSCACFFSEDGGVPDVVQLVFHRDTSKLRRRHCIVKAWAKSMLILDVNGAGWEERKRINDDLQISAEITLSKPCNYRSDYQLRTALLTI